MDVDQDKLTLIDMEELQLEESLGSEALEDLYSDDQTKLTE